MRLTRIFAFAVTAALLLSACKGKEEQAAEAAAQNPLLAHVPADTPYVFANLEPTPAAVVDAYLARFAPSLELAQDMLDDIRIEVNSDATPGHHHARLMAAILGELDGKLNRAGLESLGFSLESNNAFYGMGAFPVMRIALKDAAALRAAIGRIEADSGTQFPVLDHGGADYWRIADGSGQAGIYLAILPDHFAVGAFPLQAEADLLPAFLGQENPAEPLGAALAKLNRDKGFTGYGSGYVDLRKLAEQFLDPDSFTLGKLGDAYPMAGQSLDPVCVAEARSMLARAPRLVMGATELTANTVAVRYQLEMEEGLAGQLAGLVADVPVADDSAQRMFAASLGIQVGRLRELLLEKASAMASAPFQCPRLAGLNQAANDALVQMNRPMPPFIGNLKGFRLSLDEVDFQNPSPASARGMFSLEVEKPQMLVGMAQMFVPGVNELGLEPGGAPVELPPELMAMSVDGMHVFAAMSNDAIGLALGADQQSGLADFMDASGGNDGTFFSIDYDMAAHMELQGRMRDKMAGLQYEGQDDPPELAEMLGRLRTIEESYKNMLGRARVEARFTEQGLVIDSRMSFK